MNQKTFMLIGAAACGLFTSFNPVFAQGTAFTYQGRLSDGGNPANGSYDLQFGIYDAASSGTSQAGLITNAATAVSNGVFTVTLDFNAGVFSGADRWLEVGVRTNLGGIGTFSILSPRQKLTAAPYAVTAGSVTGVIPNASLAGAYSGVLTLNNPSDSFAGNGGGLVNLPAGQLNGTVADARLSGNVALRSGGNSLSGSQIITNGSVGIGTAAPATILHVRNSGDTQISIESSDAGSHRWTIQSSGVSGNAARDASLQLVDRTLNLSRLIVGTNGNVGIGTTSPQGALHVAGSVVVQGLVTPSATVAGNLLNLGSGATSDGSQNGISFYETSGTTAMSLGYDGVGDANHNALRIYNTSGSPLFTLQANGNLGIGTTNPATAMHVRDAGDTEVSIESGDAGSHRWTLQSSGVTGSSSLDGSFQIVDRTAGASRLLIDTNGNVGIGTSSPAAKLHVVGTASDVILPASSISASEIADEPGLACKITPNDSFFGVGTSTGSFASRTINCPAAGTVLAIATAEFIQSGNPGDDGVVILGVSTTSALPASQIKHLTLFAGHQHLATIQGVFAVSAGNTTINLLSKLDTGSGTPFIGNMHLTLLYLPTAYGSLDTD